MLEGRATYAPTIWSAEVDIGNPAGAVVFHGGTKGVGGGQKAKALPEAGKLCHAVAPFLLCHVPMKTSTDTPTSSDKSQFSQRPARRKSVSEILREAYRRYSSDATTRRAVRRCLS